MSSKSERAVITALSYSDPSCVAKARAVYPSARSRGPSRLLTSEMNSRATRIDFLMPTVSLSTTGRRPVPIEACP